MGTVIVDEELVLQSRLRLGKTQVEFAEEPPPTIAPATLMRMERGMPVQVEKAKAMAKKLKVPYERLIERKKPRAAQKEDFIVTAHLLLSDDDPESKELIALIKRLFTLKVKNKFLSGHSKIKLEIDDDDFRISLGSVYATFRLSERDTKLLLEAFVTNDIDGRVSDLLVLRDGPRTNGLDYEVIARTASRTREQVAEELGITVGEWQEIFKNYAGKFKALSTVTGVFEVALEKSRKSS